MSKKEPEPKPVDGVIMWLLLIAGGIVTALLGGYALYLAIDWFLTILTRIH